MLEEIFGMMLRNFWAVSHEKMFGHMKNNNSERKKKKFGRKILGKKKDVNFMSKYCDFYDQIGFST